jgi:5-methylthioadenosine/S-adenosylhomocysteine deaminase
MCGCRTSRATTSVGLHSHVGESKVQALVGMKRYGKTLTAHMDSLGLIGPEFTAAHAIWLDDDDLKRMRDAARRSRTTRAPTCASATGCSACAARSTSA